MERGHGGRSKSLAYWVIDDQERVLECEQTASVSSRLGGSVYPESKVLRKNNIYL